MQAAHNCGVIKPCKASRLLERPHTVELSHLEKPAVLCEAVRQTLHVGRRQQFVDASTDILFETLEQRLALSLAGCVVLQGDRAKAPPTYEHLLENSGHELQANTSYQHQAQ